MEIVFTFLFICLAIVPCRRHLVDCRKWLDFLEGIATIVDRTIRRAHKIEVLDPLHLDHSRRNGDIRAHVANTVRFLGKSAGSRANSDRYSNTSSHQCWICDHWHNFYHMIVRWCKCGSLDTPASSARTPVHYHFVGMVHHVERIVRHWSRWCYRLELNRNPILNSVVPLEWWDHWRLLQTE